MKPFVLEITIRFNQHISKTVERIVYNWGKHKHDIENKPDRVYIHYAHSRGSVTFHCLH